MAAGSLHPIVICQAGRVRGNGRVDVDVHEFLGIPYAKPPIRTSRFTRPQLLVDFQTDPSEPLDATHRRPAPWQHLGSAYDDDREACWIPKEPLGEDCLHLNIWTSAAENERLPVLVWFYGGGFSTGAATLSLYDGAMLASHGHVVVVTVNYRLGPFGFFYSPSHGCHGNMGLWDQQCALRWLAANISAFGGDQDRVTLFGESAGSVSVACHLLCPTSWPFFSRVILQSGVPTNPWAVLDPEETARRTEEVIEAVGGWDAVKDLDAETLLRHDTEIGGTCQFRFTPTVDGDFLSADPADLLRRGAFKRCPMMLGTVADEGSAYLLAALQEFGLDPEVGDPFENLDHFQQLLQFCMPHIPHFPYPASAQQWTLISHEYFPWKQTNWSEVRNSLSKLLGDFHFVSDISWWLRETVQASDSPPVFVYHFDHAPDHDDRWPVWTGTKHGDEVPYIFGDPLRECATSRYSAREVALSSTMIRLWCEFASTCDTSVLNANESLKWNQWRADKKHMLKICAEDMSVVEGHDQQREFNFWKFVIPQLRDVEECYPLKNHTSK